MKKPKLSVFIVGIVLILTLVTLLVSACSGASTTTTPPAGTTTAPPAGTTTSSPSTKPTTPAGTTTAPPAGTTTSSPSTKPTTPPAAAAPTGTIRIATPDFTYESTDPIYYESFWGWSMYDSLITFDSQGKYIPNVAESWTISPDGNTWTFKIRKDIKFQNGDPLTAADVKFSVDRFGSDASTNPWSYYLNPKYNKVSSRVVDDYTFEYVTARPEPSLVIPFAWTRILPKNYFEKVGQDGFRKNPVGSGPWKFVELISETSFKMEANTAYWGKVPAFKFVIDLQVPEEATRITMLKAGAVDIALGISYDKLVQLKKDGYRILSVGLPTLANINFQGSWLPQAGPVADIRIRQAMSYAINRQEIATTFYQGFAKPGGRWFIQEGGYGWDPNWTSDPYDPAKAKALIAQAGYPDKFSNPTIRVFVSPGPVVDLVQILQGYWKAVGLKVEINIIDSVVWGGYFFSYNRLKGTEPNVGAVIPWVFQSTFNSTYHAANLYTSTGAQNTANDPKADELYKKATAELDPVKAEQYFREFQTYVKDLYVDVGIVTIDSLIAVGPGIGDFTTKQYMSLYDALSGIQQKK